MYLQEMLVPHITHAYMSCTCRKVESVLQNFLRSMKNYNNSNSNYNREKTLKLRSSLCLRMGSLC